MTTNAQATLPMSTLPATSPNRFKNSPNYGAQLSCGYLPQTTTIETVVARCVNCRWPLAEQVEWCSVECRDEYHADLQAERDALAQARAERDARLAADRRDPEGLHPHVVESMLLNPSLMRSVRGHLADGHSEERVAYSLLESAAKRYNVVSIADCRCVVMTVAECEHERTVTW